MLTDYEQDEAEVARQKARRRIAILLVCAAVALAACALVFGIGIVSFTARATQ